MSDHGVKIQWLVIAALFCGYAGVRTLTAGPIVDKPRVLADTTAYERISRYDILSGDMWMASRPPLFPLLLKAARQDFDRAAAIQLGLSIPAWGLLALMISRSLGYPGLRIAGFALVLLFSLTRHVAGWDFVMMSESLSITTLVLFVTACLWLLENWGAVRVAAVLVTALMLAFTRDTNAWMLLALAGVVALIALGSRTRRRGLIVTGGLVLIFVLSNFSADLGNRWVFPLGNLITQRVLPDKTAVRYFESCGMPVSPELLQLSGKYANSDDQALFTGPALETLRRWLYDHGKACYVGWLASQPLAQAWQALQRTGNLVAFQDVDRYFSNRYAPLLPAWLEAVLYPEQLTLWIWGLSTLGAILAVARRAWRANRLWAAFVCLNILVFPHLFLTWHGDSMAPDRHALSVGVQLYLGAWLLVLLMSWELARRIRNGSTTSGGPSA